MRERPADATRQYIDAVATFEAYEDALAEAAKVRGGCIGIKDLSRRLTMPIWCVPVLPAVRRVWGGARLKRKQCTPVSGRERKWLPSGEMV